MKYAVEQKYYDSGNVKIKIIKCDDNEESFQEETPNYDLYFDVFDTEDEAFTFKDECLEA